MGVNPRGPTFINESSRTAAAVQYIVSTNGGRVFGWDGEKCSRVLLRRYDRTIYCSRITYPSFVLLPTAAPRGKKNFFFFMMG